MGDSYYYAKGEYMNISFDEYRLTSVRVDRTKTDQMALREWSWSSLEEIDCRKVSGP